MKVFGENDYGQRVVDVVMVEVLFVLVVTGHVSQAQLFVLVDP